MYGSLLKRARAHAARAVRRLGGAGQRASAAASTEFEEILGYHLEQAYRYRSRARAARRRGPGDRVARGDKLGSAGRRAFARGDLPAAASLLRRAIDLLAPDDPARIEAEVEVGEVLLEARRLHRGHRRPRGGDRGRRGHRRRPAARPRAPRAPGHLPVRRGARVGRDRAGARGGDAGRRAVRGGGRRGGPRPRLAAGGQPARDGRPVRGGGGGGRAGRRPRDPGRGQAAGLEGGGGLRDDRPRRVDDRRRGGPRGAGRSSTRCRATARPRR